MNEGLRWRLALSLVVFLAAVAYVLPSIPAVKSSPMGRFLPDNRISLGLDLMGGHPPHAGRRRGQGCREFPFADGAGHPLLGP